MEKIMYFYEKITELLYLYSITVVPEIKGHTLTWWKIPPRGEERCVVH